MNTIKSLFIVVLALFLSACGLENVKHDNNTCAKADNVNWVEMGDGCMYVKTHASETNQAEILIVGIHGDFSRSKFATEIFYKNRFSKDIRDKSVLVNIFRPGYCYFNGNCSDGHDHNRKTTLTELDIKRITNVVTNLKNYHSVKKVILLGHSGGSSLASLVASKTKDLVDGVVLSSCNCAFKDWKRHHNYNNKGLDPIDYIDDMDTDIKISILHGESDKNILPKFSKRYFEVANNHLDDVKIIIMPTSHNGVPNKKEVYEEIERIARFE